MSIQGPLPPSSVPPGYTQGSGPQLPAYAQAYFANQLGGVAPTGGPQETWNMGSREINTFWFLRMYGDMGMLAMIRYESIAEGDGIVPAQMNLGNNAMYVNDLKFILSQAKQSGTGFDPKLLADINSCIQIAGSDTSPDYHKYSTFFNLFGPLLNNYNGILQGKPPAGYGSNNLYSFSEHLSPDDMYNVYLLQMANAVYDSSNGLPQNGFWSNPDSPNTPSLLGSQMTEFMCYYFTQRDGTSGSALKNDLENLVNLISSCTLMLHDQPGVKPSIPPVLRSLLTNGNFDQPIFDLIKGHFDYGNPPDQDNGTPPPAWDINPNNPPTYQMSYGIDYNFLLASDQNLAQWIQQYQEAG